jgi:hypothetical protein
MVSIEPAVGLYILNAIIILSGISLVALAGVLFEQGYGTTIIGVGLFVGCVMIVLAFVAIYGLKTKNKNVLYWYFSILLIIVLMLLFSMIASFIFSGSLQNFVEANYQTISNNYPDPKPTMDQVTAMVKEYALILGGISLIALFVLLCSLVVCAMVIGTQKALGRLMKSMNLLAGLLGVGVIIIGIGMSVINIGQASLVTLCYLVGAFIVITSLFGYCGVYRESVFLLKIYFSLVMVLAVILLFFGIFVTSRQADLLSFFNNNWNTISQGLPTSITKEYFMQFMEENLTLIGALSIAGFLFMVFCMIVTVILIRTTNPFEQMNDDDDVEMDAPKKSNKILHK